MRKHTLSRQIAIFAPRKDDHRQHKAAHRYPRERPTGGRHAQRLEPPRVGRWQSFFGASGVHHRATVVVHGHALDDPTQFFRDVADAKIGTTAPIRVLRDGRRLDFKLKIGSSSSQRVRR